MQWSYWNDLLTIAGIACIAALGLYVTMSTGQVSIGHAALFGVGAYTSGMLTSHGVSFVMALPVALAICGVVGLLVAILMLRLHHWFLSIVTLGLGEFLQVVVLNSEWLGGARGLHGVPLMTNLSLVYVALGLTLFVVWRLEGSRLGHAYRLTRHDDIVAAALGVDVRWARVSSFGLGAVFAGLAGTLYIHYVGIIEPKTIGFEQSLNYLIFVAVGGVNSLWGPVVGAFSLTLLPEVLRFSVYGRYVLFGACLTVIILVRPQGLIGRRVWNGRAGVLDRVLGRIWPTYATLYSEVPPGSDRAGGGGGGG